MQDYSDISQKKKRAYIYACVATVAIAGIYFIFTRNNSYKFGGVKDEFSSISNYFNDQEKNIPKSPEIIDK